jgi:hypothetical protein
MKYSKNIKLSKAKADKYFSLYIRQRDSENGRAKCCTCGKYVSEFDCGHFISRRFEATRFDEKNANAQCLKCNRFENGNQYEHGQFIDHKWGEGTAEQILFKSKMLCKRSQADYEFISEEYKNKVTNY